MISETDSAKEAGAVSDSGAGADSRFYRQLGGISVAELAVFCEGQAPVCGSLIINSVGSLETARGRAVSYCEDLKKFGRLLTSTQAGAIFIAYDAVIPTNANFAPIYVKDPKAAFAKSARLLVTERCIEPGAHIDPSAVLDDDVSLEPGAVIGSGVRIGRGARIGANAVINCGVSIGRGSQIGAGAYVQCALIGDNVVIGPNSVIGRAGFGLAGSADMPQFGRVIIQDSVSIGAAVCIDRGAFGDTIVGEASKIDNLVQIAHNVVIGRNVVIVACSGISGSVKIGDGALLAGAVGVADHVEIGEGAILAARSGVIGDIPAGQLWAGYPARPRSQWLREAAWLARSARRRKETS